MYSIKTDIHVQGDIEFTGNLIGNVPGSSISTDNYNAIQSTDTGIFSSFGYEDLKSSDVIDKGTMTDVESSTFIGTLLSSPKPDNVTVYNWYTAVYAGTTTASTAIIIPTPLGKYVLLSGISGSGTGNPLSSQSYYMPDTGAPTVLNSTLSDLNAVFEKRNSAGTPTDYNTLVTTGIYVVEGVNQIDQSTYNAPITGNQAVRVFVQSDSSGSDVVTSQMVITGSGIMFRTGKQGQFTPWGPINVPKVASTGKNLISINSNGELTTTLKTFSVNMPSNQSSNITNPRAHIIQGTNEIFKITIGDDYFNLGGPYPTSTYRLQNVNAFLNYIPCDDNNNFIPYNITTNTGSSFIDGVYYSTLVSVVVIQGVPTKFYDIVNNMFVSRTTYDPSITIEYFITTKN